VAGSGTPANQHTGSTSALAPCADVKAIANQATSQSKSRRLPLVKPN
jgi:hypothetical protein